MERLLMIAVQAALKAGREIIKIYEDPQQNYETELKADHSPLTLADRISHQTILSFLQHTPYPVLSEEGSNIDFEERKKWESLWIVDPLDGTKEFIKRNGEFTVNIAWVKKGIPRLGVIYVPVKKELYYAAEGRGAYKSLLRQEEITFPELQNSSSRLPLSQPERPFRVVASRSHLNPETEAFIDELRKKHHPIESVSVGSSIKICRVAEGEADIYPRFAPTMEWDTAAGHAIALSAGKNIYRTDEITPLTYNKEDLHNPWFIVK